MNGSAGYAKVKSDYFARVAADAAGPGEFTQGVAYIDGVYCRPSEAKVPLFDLGFLRSDLTYDVPAVWNGRYFRLDDHIDRILSSCAKLRLDVRMDRAALRAMMIELVRKTQVRDVFVEVIITRGQPGLGERDPRKAVPAVYAFAIPYVWIMHIDLHDVGGSAVVVRDTRRIPPGAVDPTIKNVQWGDITRGFFEAYDRQAMLPLLPDGDGNIAEGCFNVFTVHNGVLRTPGRGVLQGVTRQTAMDIAKANGWEASLTDVPIGLLYSADELFVTSTAGGIMPITTLDGQPVGDGKVGPYTRTVWEQYWQLHEDPRYSFAVDYA